MNTFEKAEVQRRPISALERRLAPKVLIREGSDPFKVYPNALTLVEDAYDEANGFVGWIKASTVEVKTDEFNRSFHNKVLEQSMAQLRDSAPGIQMRPARTFGAELAAEDEAQPGTARRRMNRELSRLIRELDADIDAALAQMTDTVGRVVWFSKTVARITYFRHRFSQDRYRRFSILEHRQFTHVHDIKEARVVPHQTEVMPKVVEHLATQIPWFLDADIDVLAGQEIVREIKEEIISETTINNVPIERPIVRPIVRQTYARDPALIYKGIFVLAGWEPGEK